VNLRLVLLAAALSCAAAPAALAMGKETYKAQKQRIEAEYDAHQARCKPLKDNARDVCAEQARGARDVAMAELDLQFQPTSRNDEKLRMARADAAYAVTLKRCEPLEGNAREVCRKDARAVHAAAKVEAKLQKEVAEETLRSEKQVRERTAAHEKQTEAQFAAARERCEMLPGEARENCLQDARRRFGRI
jgi:hypothetical protein